MFIIIDGYNLLKQIAGKPFVTQSEREQFINSLGKYAHAQNHEIYIVFDGGSYIRPTKEIYKRITVIYSGVNQSADDYIRNYIEHIKSKDILVVSTDRKISSFAKQRGLHIADSLDFYHVINREREKNNNTISKATGQPRKLSEIDNPELDALMRESARVIYKKEDTQEEHNARSGNSQQISKKEKKLLKIIKKL